MKINRNRKQATRTAEAAQVVKKVDAKATTQRKQKLKEVQTKGGSCDASILSTTLTDERAPRIPSTGRTRGNSEPFKSFHDVE